MHYLNKLLDQKMKREKRTRRPSAGEIAAATGLSRFHVYTILGDETHDMRVSTARAFCRYLDCTFDDFLSS